MLNQLIMSICTSKNKILSLVVVILTCFGCKKPDTSNNNVNNNIVKVYTPTTPNTQHISV